MRKTSLKPLCLTILILALVVTSCNMPSGEQVITPDVTQAYQTVQARLTESALLSPSPTLTMTPAPTTAVPSPTEGTAAPSPTQRPPAQPTAAAVKQCDQAAPGSPIDVTIPDDTRLTPGQSFTKTWRLLNNGTCTWTREYTIALFSGEAMGAPAGVNLPNDVAPGGSVDISVTMVAPATAGTYRGDWKLRNASGTWFGIGPGAASTFWVKVVVAGTPGTPGPPP